MRSSNATLSTRGFFPERDGVFRARHGRVTRDLKVARYSFSRSIPPKFERKLRSHKQGFAKIDTTVVLDKEENWL